MKNLVIISLLVILTSACQSTVKKPSIWSTVPKNFVEGEGLLVIGISPRAMNNKMKLSNRAERLLSFSIKNLSTGFVKTIQHNPRKSAVVIIPSGRYCLNSLKTYINLKLHHCKAPYFDVEAGSVENGGITTVGVNYDAQKNKVSHKVFGVYRSTNKFDKILLSSGKQKIEEFYRRQSTLSSHKVFYIKTPFGSEKIIRLFEDGRAELQKYAQNQPYYNEGTWVKVDKEYLLSFYKGNLIYRLKSKGDTIVGLVTSKFKTKNLWSTFDENWLIIGTKKLHSAKINFSIAEQSHIVIESGMAYPKAAYLGNETGVVELSFNLVHERAKSTLNLYRPINISIESSSIKSEYIEAIIDNFRKHKYSLPMDAVNDNQFREKIMLKIIDGVPSITFENSPVKYFNNLSKEANHLGMLGNK